MSRTLDRGLGEFEAMPQVGGDLIVESGSNVDGEWTRWADGTQTVACAELTLTALDNTAGALYSTNKLQGTFPVAFFDAGNAPCLSAGDSGNATVIMNARAVNFSTYEALAYFYLSSATVRKARVGGIGRWK